jgi:hypothetical protein
LPALGVWPLSQAVQACFGTSSLPDDVQVPRRSVEFEVAEAGAVAAAAEELRSQGHALLHGAKTEPWGRRWLASFSRGCRRRPVHAPSLHEELSTDERSCRSFLGGVGHAHRGKYSALRLRPNM